MGLPQKPKIEAMNDSPGSLLGINQKESKSHDSAAFSAPYNSQDEEPD